FKKVLAISQLRGILAQNRRIQELDELKKLYESTSTTSLLNHSKDVPSNLTVQYTNDESDYDEIDNMSEDNEDDITLWSSISDDDSDENLSDSESTDLDKLLDNQESSVGRKVKWPLNRLFTADLEAPFFATIYFIFFEKRKYKY
ncbi:17176_t:CDS:1, partial [Dentiscutata heterogama]